MGQAKRRLDVELSTPKPSKSSTRVPSTPFKAKRPSRAERAELTSVARSLTPLFNGFTAARDRASQLGGRYAKKKARVAKAREGASGSASTAREVVATGTVSTRRTERRTAGGLSVHTGDVVHGQEKRVLQFDSLLGKGGNAKPTGRRKLETNLR